jgi:hypothetical protein
MFVYVSDVFQLGLDCAAHLGDGRQMLYGWLMAPRGSQPRLSVTVGDGTACAFVHHSQHGRPDVVPTDRVAAEVRGFHIAFDVPEGARGGLVLRANAGPMALQARLGDPAVETDLAKATAAREWGLNFTLLEEVAAAGATRLPLLGFRGRPYGAFADWVARIPRVASQAESFGPLAELRGAVTAAGDVGVALRLPVGNPPLRSASLRAVLLLHLDDGDGGPPDIRPVSLGAWRSSTLAEALIGYGATAEPPEGTLVGADLLAEARIGEERIWVRFQPRIQDIPAFFDTLLQTAQGPQPSGERRAQGRGVLAELLEARATRCAALLAEVAEPASAEPSAERLLLVLGVEDLAAQRVLEAVAERLNGRCDRLLLLGNSAHDAAAALAADAAPGAPAVLAGAQALRALTERPGALVTALSARGLAEAMIHERLDQALREGALGGAIPRLLALHRLAGAEADLAESLGRFVHMTQAAVRGATRGWDPLPHVWGWRDAAAPLNAHLEALWRGALTARRAAREPIHA